MALNQRRDSRSSAAREYRPLYGTARWQATRAAQLQAEPLCRKCADQGRVTPATVCHHIDPESKTTEHGFFAGPYMSLCQSCHDGPVQQEEKIGYSNAIAADGWPTCPKHPANR